MIGLASALLFAAGMSQSNSLSEAEQRQLAHDLLEQLVAEDDNPGGFRDYRQHDHISIMTHPRASVEGGLCERDRLTVERAPATQPSLAASSTIRSITA